MTVSELTSVEEIMYACVFEYLTSNRLDLYPPKTEGKLERDAKLVRRRRTGDLNI